MSVRDEAEKLFERMERYAQRFERTGKDGHGQVIRRWVSEVRAILDRRGIAADPEDCNGVMDGKFPITHLMVDRGDGEYCARCGMTPAQVAAARSAGIEPGEGG